MGSKYGRVLFLKEYASYIKDSMLAELCELPRNLMLSIDVKVIEASSSQGRVVIRDLWDSANYPLFMYARPYI